MPKRIDNMEINVLQLHKKDVEVFDKIEDKVSINTTNGTLAVSDGATQGFCSGIWADVVTTEFTGAPVFSADNFCNLTLKNSVAKYSHRIDSLPVNENKVFARLLDEKKKDGGYSTFVGLQFFKERHVKVLCVGDSNLFYVVNRSIQSVPSASLEELNNSSTFINSRHVIEDKVDRSIVKAFQLNVSNGGEMFIVTDAIARYLFKNPDQFATLQTIDCFENLLAFAEERWAAGTLEQDDLTIVKIRIDADPVMAVRYSIPPDGFRFGTVAPLSPEPSQSRPQQVVAAPDNEKIIADLRSELLGVKKNTGEEIVALKKDLKNLSGQYALQANRTKSLMIVCAILLASIFVFIYLYVGEKNEFQAEQEQHKNDLVYKNLELANLRTSRQQAAHSTTRGQAPIVKEQQAVGGTGIDQAGKASATTGGAGSHVNGVLHPRNHSSGTRGQQGQQGVAGAEQKAVGQHAATVKANDQKNGAANAANSRVPSTASTTTANQQTHSTDNGNQQQTNNQSSPNEAPDPKKVEPKKEDPKKSKGDTTIIKPPKKAEKN